MKFIVYATESRTLLDQSRADLTPGVLGIGAPGVLEFPFSVPANTLSLQVRATWTLGTNDYDLRVLDPSGAQVTSSGGGVPGTSETAGTTNPVAGTWTAALDKFATTADTSVRVVVTATTRSIADPLPRVTSGGPYRFPVGAAQAIAGTVSGGTARSRSAGTPTSTASST